MIDILYAAIRDQVKQELTGVKWIDLDSGQLDNPEQNYPFPFPAVFIDFPNIDWQDAGERMQDGDVQVNCRIAFRIYNQTHGNTQDNAYDTFTKAMDALAMVTTIHSKLQGFSDGLTFNRLSRISTTTEKREDGLKVFNMVYTCSARDKSAMKKYDVATGSTLTIRQAINRSHLRLTGSVPDSTPEIGSNVVITLQIENTGSETGTAASVNILIGDGLTYVSDNGSTSGDPDDRIWSAGSVAADATKTLLLTVNVNSASAADILATLTYAEQPDPPSHHIADIDLSPVAPAGD